MQLIFLGNWFTDETLKALGWTLFHSLWIGLLAAALSGIIIISTRRSAARLRYNLLIGVMFLFLLACTVTFFVQSRSSGVAVVELQETGTVYASSLSSSGQLIVAPAGFIDLFTRYFNANADIFVLLWMLFFVVHCIKLVKGLGAVQRLRNYKTHLPGEEWAVKLEELANRLGIRQSVRLLQSELVKVPVAVGFLKPVILVPLGVLSDLPPAQVEAILLHELSHIRRKDYLMNLVQRFAETIFFFNPSFTWLCSLIRQEREACCDDMVVATTGQEGNYLEALVSFQEYSVSSPMYVMAIKSKRHYLLNRVKRLLTRENKKLDLMEKLLLMAGLIVFTAFTIIPQKEKAERPPMDIIASIKQPGTIITKKEVPVKLIASQTHRIKPSKPVTRDTIPVKSNQPVIDINSISTQRNDDGKTKNQTIIATDKAGKKYIITKMNDKITFFQVDDKVIPQNEVGNYASVFKQIDEEKERNKTRKLNELEKAKIAYEEKKNVFDSKQKQLNKKEDSKENLSKEVIEKKIEKRREELEIQRKILNQQREELIAVKKEVEFKKKEVKTKDGKEKELGEQEIKNKEAIINIKLKEIEKRKEVMEVKKKEIGHEKEKLELEKLKEKHIKLQKETGTSLKPVTPVSIVNNSSIQLSSRSEDIKIVKTDLYEHINKTDGKLEYEPIVKLEYNISEPGWPPVAPEYQPTAPGWQPTPSKPSLKRTLHKPRVFVPRKSKLFSKN